MKSRILAIIAGVITAGITVFVLESLSHLIYPPPENIDLTDYEALKEAVKGMPTGALVSVLLAWMISGIVGGFVGGKIDSINWKQNSIIIGLILLLFAIFNLYMVPHPLWMTVIAVVGYVPMAIWGGKLAAGR